MILNNNFTYSKKHLNSIETAIDEILTTLKDTDRTLMQEIQNPSDETENVVYLDRRPIAEFASMQKTEVSLNKLVQIYSEWNNILAALVVANKGHYKNKKVCEFLLELRRIVGTFGSFFKDSKDS